MSAAIVLPNITEWTKDRITAIYSATTDSDFETAFDDFLSHEVTITSNGQRFTRDEYKQKLLSEKKGEISGGVSFTGSVQADGTSGQLFVVWFHSRLHSHKSDIGTLTLCLYRLELLGFCSKLLLFSRQPLLGKLPRT